MQRRDSQSHLHSYELPFTTHWEYGDYILSTWMLVSKQTCSPYHTEMSGIVKSTNTIFILNLNCIY